MLAQDAERQDRRLSSLRSPAFSARGRDPSGVQHDFDGFLLVEHGEAVGLFERQALGDERINVDATGGDEEIERSQADQDDEKLRKRAAFLIIRFHGSGMSSCAVRPMAAIRPSMRMSSKAWAMAGATEASTTRSRDTIGQLEDLLGNVRLHHVDGVIDAHGLGGLEADAFIRIGAGDDGHLGASALAAAAARMPMGPQPRTTTTSSGSTVERSSTAFTPTASGSTQAAWS